MVEIDLLCIKVSDEISCVFEPVQAHYRIVKIARRRL